MTEILDESPEQATYDEILVRTVQEILASYDPEAIRLAAKVGSHFPHMHVVDGELKQKETVKEQIVRQLGRTVAASTK